MGGEEGVWEVKRVCGRWRGCVGGGEGVWEVERVCGRWRGCVWGWRGCVWGVKRVCVGFEEGGWSVWGVDLYGPGGGVV